MTRLLANMKKYFWKFAPKHFFASRQRIFWSSRKNSPQDPHLDTYWTSQNDLPNREMLISLIVNQLKVPADRSAITVFEFGCHCGPNLNRIRKHAADHNLGLKMYGCDINQEAAEQCATRVPGVEIISPYRSPSDLSKLPKLIDVAFVNAVFYCMHPKETFDVISILAEKSRCIIIGDNVTSAEANASTFDRQLLDFCHPYARWLENFGFTIEKILAPEPVRACNGFIIAKKV